MRYSKINRNQSALALVDLVARVPAAFSKHHDNSGNYRQIDTMAIVNALAKSNIVPVSAQQKTRDLNSAHTITFAPYSSIISPAKLDLGGLIPQIILHNSHDGKSAFSIQAGLYRLVCSNGLLVADSNAEIRIRHDTPMIEREIIEGSYEVVQEAGKAIANASNLRLQKIVKGYADTYARAAIALRHDVLPNEMIQCIRPAQEILLPRRYDDSPTNKWTLYNTVQENLLAGNYYFNGKKARQITSYDETRRLNLALWSTITSDETVS